MHWIVWSFFAVSMVGADSFTVPTPHQSKQIFKAIRNEMVRLDGEGLQSRVDRPENFLKTTRKLLRNSLREGNALDFYSLFKRLDATYPNLHSRLVVSPELEKQIVLPVHQNPGVWLLAEVVPTQKTRLFVDFIDDEKLKSQISEDDEIVAINGRSIRSWMDENFLFCKFSQRIQCDRNFELNLHSLNLSWKGGPLSYRVLHKGQPVDVAISFKNPTNSGPSLKKLCDYQAAKRYPGFKLVHQGYYNCLFEKIDNPSIALMRIPSFQYRRNADPNAPIKSVKEEVDAFYPFWKANSAKYKELIIDLLDNGGGNEPVPYYQILFHGKFQEQYVQFKKTSEMENSILRGAIFWDESAQEIFFQKLVQTGEWNRMRIGDFTKPIPMFCAGPDCENDRYESREHSFRGNVRVMVNEWCVSSCDGFAWAMKKHLDAKLYGFPQAADAAYSRLRIDALRDKTSKSGFRIVVNPERAELSPEFIIGQVVAVSRATDEKGEPFNGHPLPLEKLVPYRLGESYRAKVLEAILSNIYP